MLHSLADYEQIFGPLRLFRYISFRAVAGAGTALFIALLIAPPVIAFLRRLKFGQVFRSKDEVGKLAGLHAAKSGTPTMGGLIVFSSVVLSTLLWAAPNTYVLTALGVYSGLTLIGLADDLIKIRKRNSDGLPGRWKLAGQAVLSVLVVWVLTQDATTGEYIRQLWVPFYKEPLMASMPIALLLLLTFLVVAGSSNAINLTDGVDGLAIGCTITVAMAYGLMAYAAGNAIYAGHLLLPFMPGAGELTIVMAILIAASLGFLWHNAHPAAVFMGDTGSLALGGLIGIVALMILQPFTLLLIGGVFVMEAGSVILQVGSFKLRGKRIFRMAPIHHHFELKGWAETQVVTRFWILSLIFAIIGLATLKLR